MTWISRLTDVPSAVALLQRNLRGLPFFPAFLCCLIFAVLLLPTTYVWWVFDLQPTWTWLAFLRTPPELADSALAWHQAVATLGVTTSVVLWGLLFAPTLVECTFPQAGRGIPALNFTLYFCLMFDYVTDFPALWRFWQGVVWFDQFPSFLAWLLRGILTIITTFFASTCLQVIVACLFMGMVFLFLSMAKNRGGTDGEDD